MKEQPPTGDALGFGALKLQPSLVTAVTALGYEEPTPIQREAIPLLLEGRDLVGQAGTGTGKTAAFILPILDRLARAGSAKTRAARALVLVPTRELAMQVAEATHKYARGSRLNVVPLYGGAPMDQQIRALSRGVDIVVATPGRALDHLRRRTLDLAALEVLVLDEADEMLDMGFADDIDAIVAATPTTRQTALFAATWAPRIAVDRRTPPAQPVAGDHRAREAVDRQAAARAAGGLSGGAAPQERRARARARLRGPEVGDRVLPDPDRSRRAHRDPARARLRRRGAARRDDAEAARPGDAAVPAASRPRSSSPPTWRRAGWTSTTSRT